MVFHGKSFTSKVSLREVCQAILKYGFVASPYPIIISAEIHCSIGQQDLVATIMMEVFGEKLVRMPMDGESEKDGLVITSKKIEVKELPSPEQLKGKILLKVGTSCFFSWSFFVCNIFVLGQEFGAPQT
jgi:phosphatidylinositol phospholipase C, delta